MDDMPKRSAVPAGEYSLTHEPLFGTHAPYVRLVYSMALKLAMLSEDVFVKGAKRV
jgi:hypothetical protein